MRRTHRRGLVRRSSAVSVRRTAGEGGSALLNAVILVGIVMALTAAFLLMSTRESRETFESIRTQQTFSAAESGINNAVNDVNTSPDANKDGRSDTDGHALGNVTGALVLTTDTSGGSTVTLYNGLASAVPRNSGRILGMYNVTATYVPPAYTVSPDVPDAGTDVYTLTSAADDGTTGSRAAVRTQASKVTRPLFQMAMFGDLKVSLSGTVFTDSYDSALGNYAGQATHYDAATKRSYARTNGDVGSNHDIDVGGSVAVYGDVSPGPTGGLTVSGGGVAISGSTANLAAEIPLDPVTYSGAGTAMGDLRLTGGVTDIATGTYHYTDMNLAGTAILRVRAGQTVTINSDGGLKMGAQNAFVVEPGGRLTFNSNGDVQIAGQGMTQGTLTYDSRGRVSGITPGTNPYAGDVRINVVSGKTVTMSGTSDFYGVVYAPDTTVKFSGTSKYFGAVIGDSVSDTGTQDFHYDERLGRDFVTPTTYYRIKGWQRLDDTTAIQGQFPTQGTGR